MEADDDLVLLALTQQLYNKKLTLSDNEITDAAIALGDSIKSDGTKFVRMPIGLPGQVPTVDEAGLDWIWADLPEVEGGGGGDGGIPDDDSVSTIKIQNNAVTSDKIVNNAVITAKIPDLAISTAKIANLAVSVGKLAGSITGSKLTNGTITSTQIASGTVTNANLAGSIADSKLLAIADLNKLPNTIRYDLSKVKYGAHTQTTADGGEGIWNGFLTSTGTFTSHVTTTTNFRARWTTAGSTNAQAGLRTNGPYAKPAHSDGVVNGTLLQGRLQWESVQDNLFWFVGMVGGTPAFPTPGSDIATWMNGLAGIGIWVDKPTSDNIQVYRNDGTSTGTAANLSGTPLWSGGGQHGFSITFNPATPSFTVWWDDVANTYTTDIPGDNQQMGMLLYAETKNTDTKAIETPWLQTILEPRS
jgi:hypothetical protein